MYVVKIGVLTVFNQKSLIKTTKTEYFYQFPFVVFYQPICFVG